MLGALRYASPQARVRARRSWLLSDRAWTALTEATDLTAVTHILRETHYADVIDEDSSQIALRLLARVPHGEWSLGRSLDGGPRAVMDWYRRRFELHNVKMLVRGMASGQAPGRVRAALIPLEESSIVWDGLLGIATVAALVEALRHTPFAKPLEEATERYQQERRSFYLEVSLDLAYFERLVRLVGRLHGKDRADAERLLGRWVEFQNLLWAYRYRVFSRLTPEEIVNFTLHRAWRVDIAVVRRIATGSPLGDEAARLGLGSPGNRPEHEELVALELTVRRDLLRIARDTLQGSLFHLGAVIAYALLAEAEVHDLITLIGAVRRGVPRAEMRRFLLREW